MAMSCNNLYSIEQGESLKIQIISEDIDLSAADFRMSITCREREVYSAKKEELTDLGDGSYWLSVPPAITKNWRTGIYTMELIRYRDITKDAQIAKQETFEVKESVSKKHI